MEDEMSRLMGTDINKSTYFARFVVEGARINREHVGERLMSSLRADIANIVRETNFSPKFQEMDFDAVCRWLHDHIVFDHEGVQVGLRDEDIWLWKEDK
jgi:hypothetical protein